MLFNHAVRVHDEVAGGDRFKAYDLAKKRAWKGFGGVTSFLLYCAYHTDYHWDRHLYFVITSSMHRH
jgi:hypothetical protein